ncbi:MAG: hypothetical protein QNJ70_28075 [Xenococcaceae cyanobacterium MO_207.B15]|nr:hypothetical protein [Xenococcaceae cyanobacterium MO_207.B15]
MSKILSRRRLTQTFLTLVLVGYSSPSLSETTGVSYILQVKGDVQVKKEQWTKFQQASIGLTLSSDDKLEVGVNALAKVYCSNQTIWEVKPGTYSVSDGCPLGTPIFKLPDGNNRNAGSR